MIKVKKISIILIVGVCGALIYSGCAGTGGQRKKQMFLVRAQGTGDLIVGQASASMNLARSYLVTWEYAKVTGTDFETAAKSMPSEGTRLLKDDMIENKGKIKKLLDSLEDPPKECEDALLKLEELFEIYAELHSLVMKPGGDWERFEESINELQGNILEVKQELDALLIGLED